MSSPEALLCVWGMNVKNSGHFEQILDQESAGHSTVVVNATNSQDATAGAEGVKKRQWGQVWRG